MRIRVKRCSQASAGTLLGICDGSNAGGGSDGGHEFSRRGDNKGRTLQDLLKEGSQPLLP